MGIVKRLLLAPTYKKRASIKIQLRVGKKSPVFPSLGSYVRLDRSKDKGKRPLLLHEILKAVIF